MKHLRQIITEKQRDATTALKVLNRITRNPKNIYYKGHLRTSNREYNNEFDRSSGDILKQKVKPSEKKYNSSIESIPLSSIKTVQPGVEISHLKRHLKNLNYEKKIDHPLELVHHDGDYFVLDGNHRVMKHRLLGNKHITATVYRKIDEEFITEVKRDSDRAIKLANYISKRHSGIKAQFFRPDSEFDEHDRNTLLRAVEKYQIRSGHSPEKIRTGNIDDRLSSEFKTAKSVKFPIHKIITTQSTVETPGVVYKLKHGDTDPVKIVKHKGIHYLVNGHHRYSAAKLKGDTHIPAHVVMIR